MINRGVLQPDKSYQYFCLKCDGAGLAEGKTCDHCYALDLDLLRSNIRVARGERYYALLKAILSLVGKSIYDDAQQIKAQRDGKMTPIDVAYLAVKYDLYLKVVWEWLQETGAIQTVSYEDIQAMLRRKKMTVGQLLDLAQSPEYRRLLDLDRA